MLKCSFCRKTQEQVQKLVAGPGVYICDECVAVATKVMQDDPQSPQSAAPPQRSWFRRFWNRIGCSKILRFSDH